MRRFGWAWIGVLVAALEVCEQNAGEVSQTENLDTVLQGWEKAAAGLKRFVISSERSTKGTALTTSDAPAKYIWTDRELFEFSSAERKIVIYELPQIKQLSAEMESPLMLLFGMSADEAKTRYFLEYKGSDKNYDYVLIRPRQKQLVSAVTEVRLSLFRANHLPAQIWYQEPDKDTTWNFSMVQVPPTYFHPAIPPGWTVERVQSDASSRKKQ